MPKKEPPISTPWADPDDAPEWTPEAFERAEIRHGDQIVRPATGTLSKRGRPRLEQPQQQDSVGVDQDVIDRLRADGPGWQSRINAILKKAVEA